MSNLDRRAAPVLEPTSKTDVLSESTDLNSLLVAILGEERQETDDRAQIVAAIDAQVAGVVKELGLDSLLAEPRRASDAAARSAPAELTAAPEPVAAPAADPAAGAESDPVSTDSSPAPAPSSRLRDTLAKLFPSRISVWLVAVAIGGAAFVTVNAIGERNSNSAAPAAVPKPGRDVVLPIEKAQAPTAMPASGARDAGAAAAVNPAVVANRRAMPPSLPAQVTPSRKQAASIATTPAVKRSEVAPVESTTSSVTPSAPPAAPVVAYESRPVEEPRAAVVPDIEPPLEIDTTLVPLPAIIAERPMVSTATSPSAAATTTSVAVRRPARVLARSVPDYPSALRAAKVAGTVGVTFTIDTKGMPTNVQARSGPPPLRAVAEAAVRQWRYAPAMLNDAAVESEMSVQFTFGPDNPPRPE